MEEPLWKIARFVPSLRAAKLGNRGGTMGQRVFLADTAIVNIYIFWAVMPWSYLMEIHQTFRVTHSPPTDTDP